MMKYKKTLVDHHEKKENFYPGNEPSGYGSS